MLSFLLPQESLGTRLGYSRTIHYLLQHGPGSTHHVCADNAIHPYAVEGSGLVLETRGKYTLEAEVCINLYNNTKRVQWLAVGKSKAVNHWPFSEHNCIFGMKEHQ